MKSVTLVETGTKFPSEIVIASSELDLLSPNTIDEVTTLCSNAEDQAVGLRVVELRCEMDGDGLIADGSSLVIRGQEGDRLVEIDPHSAMSAIRTSELVAGAMAITDKKLETKILSEIESHASAHDLKYLVYNAVIFPAGVLVYPSMPFRLLELSLEDHGKLYPSDIDRAFKVFRHRGSSSHGFLRTGAMIDHYLKALARSPQTAQVRKDHPRGVNASLLETRFILK